MRLLLEILNETIKNKPNKVAIVDNDGIRNTTYLQFEEMSNKIAAYFEYKGLSHGDAIIIAGSRRCEYFAAEIAALKIGCAVIPISNSYPQDRINTIKDDSKAKLVASDDVLDNAIKENLNFKHKDENILKESDIAFITYTSGSTGKPKGIYNTYKAMTFNVMKNKQFLKPESEDIFLSNAPLYFVACLFDCFYPVANGYTVHLISDELRSDVRKIENYVKDNNINIMFISPQMLKLYRDKDSNLKKVITGSDKIAGFDNGNYIVINSYGMSETGAVISYYTATDGYKKSMPIGKPLDGFGMYILDDNGNEVPDGELGEICISGVLAQGYINRPKETKKVFVKNPFIDRDGNKVMCHTNDIGKRLPDGNVVYENRKDWMIKINGQRVETGEVEAIIINMPSIENAIVKGFTNEEGQSYMCAYYVACDYVDEELIKKELKCKVPSYMIPSFFIKLDKMPLNANGKINRKALLPPDITDLKKEYEAPCNEKEEILCKAFESTLKCGKIGVNDDFFSLGGNSINVMKLIEACHIDSLAPHDILKGRTPKCIAQLLLNENGKNIYNYSKEERDYYFLTDSQMGVYLECLEKPESTMYNIPLMYKINGELNKDKLQKAVVKAIENHDITSVSIKNIDGEPHIQKTNKKCSVNILNISQNEVYKYSNHFIKPFDLENDLLYRAQILCTEKNMYLLMDFHHLIFDGTSVQVILKDIKNAYEEIEMEKEEISLFDISVMEESIKDSDAYKEGMDFFERNFDSVDVDSNIIPDVDFKDEKTNGRGKALVKTLLNDTNNEKIAAFLKKNAVTENSLFMSAFAFTLAKFTSQGEALFCTVNNGRHDIRLKNTLGMLVRTLPIHAQINDKEKSSQYISRIQNDFMETMSHDICHFSEIANKFNITSDIMFVYQGEILNGINIYNAYLEAITLNIEPQANLSLMILKKNGIYEANLEYRDNLYSEELMESFIESMDYVLSQMICNEALENVQIASESQRKLIDTFNKTEYDYDKTKTVIDLFREQVLKDPNHIAIIYKDIKMTYKELDDASEKLAKYIYSLGIGCEDTVSILINRSENMPICSIGTLKSGAAYEPLDPSYPMERLKFMMEDANSKLLIADEELLSLVPDYNGPVLLTKDIKNLQNNDIVLKSPNMQDLFIMLYTSGSTGVPKGCMLEHRNIAAYVNWFTRYFDYSEKTISTAYASFGFDANMMETYTVLTAGGTLVIVSEESRLDLITLRDYFNDLGVTNSFMTTQVGRQFALMGGFDTLSHMLVGGEKLVSFDPPEKVLVHNGYGPTETTVMITNCDVTRKYEDIPIGKALDNIKLYVVDKNGKLLPPGAAGELWVSGMQVSRGYLNRPEQNAKVYTANTFTNEEGYERVYHSGDIVRYLSDGNLQFVGRRDAQVKIRGFRIELTEVEEVIRKFNGIEDATVAAFDDPAGGKYIAAYVVSKEKVNVDDLNKYILESKPPYMVPAVTMQIDKIPLNQNQKVNKRALPIPQKKFEDVIPPQNDMQQKILDIIAEVIGNNEFGITTDIYMAGLTSIGAVKLNVLLSKAFETVIKTKDLKDNPTVKQLEKLINESVAEEKFEYQGDYPITQTQMGIFVESMAHRDTTVYNIPVLIKIHNDIDTGKLKEAITKAINAHPYIKTRLFMNDNGDIRCKRLDDDENFDIETIESNNISDIKDNLVKPFNLMGGRLFRISIIKAESKYLFIEMHHIISDGTSMNIFINDISKAYGNESLLKESYTGFEAALSEEKARQCQQYKKAKAYYEGIFSGCDAECLPITNVKDEKNKISKSMEIYGDLVTADDIKYFCKQNNLSLNAFFTSAFGVLISKLCRKDDAVFTTIYNGRNDSRLYNSITMLVKTFPVLCKTGNGNKAIKDLIMQTQNQLIDSMANDIYSFAEISRAFNISADVMFAYQGEDFSFDSMCNKKAELIPLSLNEAKAPFNVNVFIEGSRIKYFFEYRADMYDSKIIEGFIDAYEVIVSQFINKDDIKEISLLSHKSKKEMMNFNDTDSEVQNVLPSKLFENQVNKTPDKIAVIAKGEKLTFNELNKKSNKIANTLIEKGIKPDNIAALMLERSVNVYAVRQGILKSGGAFLSIEPHYPDDRISYIIENSKAKYFITTKALYNERKELLDKLSCSIIFLEDMYKESNTSNPKALAKPDNLAYCIYTSGSTGKPKGVMIEQRNLVNMLNYCDNNILAKDYVDNSTVFLGLAAITFDVSIIEEMMPMYHGKTVAMASEEEIHNPILLAKMMMETGVDMMKCTPSYMMTIIDFEEVRKALKNLKAIIIGAEAFPKGLYEKMRDAGMNAKIFNSYGPTETTVTVTIDELDGKNITIGSPANNVKIFMLDKFDNILPVYVPGELTIIGDSVGRGYVGLEKVTKEKFVMFNGKKAYRSGDIAYWNKNGKIEFCGRADNQVKLRGLRVELDEIENIMNTYDSIKRSVVLVKESSQGQYLCGYFTASEKVDTQDLTKHMAKTLTNYMIPGVFVQLDTMPMNNNGKVDKKALPEPEVMQTKKAGKKPQTEMQKKLCEIFKMAIGINDIGIDDDFFEMGGTSLSASKVAMKCMVENIPVVYANIFDYTTVEKLESFINNQNKTTQSQKTQSDSNENLQGIEKVLQYNTIKYVDEIKKEDIGKVLVSGSTGFLGMHVLKELIDSDCKKIYCLVRKGKSQSAKMRLQTMLVYYFDNDYEELFHNRINVINGDITDSALGDTLKNYDFDTIINCAACVKHFVKGDLLERVNVHGVENLISICKDRDKKLVQVSTVSIAGEGINGAIDINKKIHENELFFGQNLDNKYAQTKFKAEEAMLKAIENGLRGKIVRVGNLMSRYIDGEFQINYATNGFMKRLQGYSIIGKFPVNDMDREAEFSPIDYTAKAIVTLAATNDKFTVFHAYNCHNVHMANIIDAMNNSGINIDIVTSKEFKEKFEETLSDEKKNMSVSGLIAYMNQDKTRFFIDSENEFTTKALYRLGFSWPLIDKEYLYKSIKALVTLGFFDEEYI